ncbi:MAG: sulfatase-like hydrolase/transferase [Candidatus Eisenbacteria sp.]|nr:sulfatase-like hydrolase/transferase [Candidatus Eisenbacteria bacterium]
MSSPNIILVTLDTMRADRLGRERNGRLLTPNLSEFGSEGRVFARAVAAGIPTYFGFPPMFRGGLALDGGKVIGLPVGTTTFVEELSRRGYRTAAVIASNPYLSHYYRYDAGFDVFDDFYASDLASRSQREKRTFMRLVRSVAGEGGTARLKRAKAKYNYLRECARGANPALLEGSRAEKVTERGLALAREMDGDRPFFLWLHYMDLHGYFYATQADRRAVTGASTPIGDARIRWNRYRYVDRWTGQVIRSQEDPLDRDVEHTSGDEEILNGFYDAAMLYADRCLAPLLDWVRRSARTVTIVTADHGEQFYDHGKIGHAPIAVYDEVARVPLLVHGPGIERGEVNDWVSHSSIPVSIRDVAGLPSGGEQAPSLLAGAPGSEPVFTETLFGVRAPFPRRRFDEHTLLIACRRGAHKYVWREKDGAEQLFDLDSDPGEKENLIGRSDVAAAEAVLRAAVRGRAARIGVMDARAKLSESVRKLGRSMGVG